MMKWNWLCWFQSSKPFPVILTNQCKSCMDGYTCTRLNGLRQWRPNMWCRFKRARIELLSIKCFQNENCFQFPIQINQIFVFEFTKYKNLFNILAGMRGLRHRFFVVAYSLTPILLILPILSILPILWLRFFCAPRVWRWPSATALGTARLVLALGCFVHP